MDEIGKLVNGIKNAAKKQVPVQTVWAKVKNVDWNEKTMTVTGLTDELDYADVLLGLGSEFKKPVLNSKCLIGIIANKDAATFLIHADEVEEHLLTDTTGFEWRLSNGVLTMNGDQFGGLIKIQELVSRINNLEQKHDSVCTQLEAMAVPVSGSVSGPAVPGSYTASKVITQTTVEQLENIKIKHG
jgi:hypothetical protein